MTTKDKLNELIMILNSMTVSGVANAERITKMYDLLIGMLKEHTAAEQADDAYQCNKDD